MTVTSRRSQLRGQQSPVLGGLMRNYDPRALGFPLNHGESLMPPMDVVSAEGSIEIVEEGWLEETAMNWPDGEDPNVVAHDSLDRTTYKTTPNSISRFITDREIRDRKTVESERDYVDRQLGYLVHNFKLQLELQIRTKATTVANYDAGHSVTLGASDQLDGDSADFAGVFRTMKKAQRDVMKKVTDVLIPATVWDLAADDADFRSWLRVTNGPVTLDDFRKFMGMIPHIAENYYKTSGSLTPIWQDIVGYHMPMIPAVSDPNMVVFGRMIRSYADNYDNARRWRVEGPMGWFYAVGVDFQLKWGAIDNVTDEDSIGGYLVKDPLATP